MWPPPEDATPQPPPLATGGPPGPGGPGGAGGPAASRPWLLWAGIALGLVAAALVILAIILATRSPSPPPVAVTTPTPSPSPSPLATPVPTLPPTPVPTPTPAPPPLTPAQQARVLFPAGGTECGAAGDYAACPVTVQLIANATRWRSAQPSTPLPLCRCQSTYSSPVARENRGSIPAGDQGNPNIDAVDVALTLSPSGKETMVVLFGRQSNGSWQAYETYCTNPQNRLSAGSPQPCS
jgi:hypothetical protein